MVSKNTQQVVQFQLLLDTQESVNVNNTNPSKFVDKTESFDLLERILAVSLTILSALSRLVTPNYSTGYQ